ncbi:hypothetical protein BC832DRAFT_591254 [Gaertneriomyces semiglobifer]|nr:hypothetical protein BC832DRAFT_591254 [Gaertneriomyces semiglobifer]
MAQTGETGAVFLKRSFLTQKSMPSYAISEGLDACWKELLQLVDLFVEELAEEGSIWNDEAQVIKKLHHIRTERVENQLNMLSVFKEEFDQLYCHNEQWCSLDHVISCLSDLRYSLEQAQRYFDNDIDLDDVEQGVVTPEVDVCTTSKRDLGQSTRQRRGWRRSADVIEHVVAQEVMRLMLDCGFKKHFYKPGFFEMQHNVITYVKRFMKQDLGSDITDSKFEKIFVQLLSNYGFQQKRQNMCKHCHKPRAIGCCDKYSTNERSERYIILNWCFTKSVRDTPAYQALEFKGGVVPHQLKITTNFQCSGII